MIDEFVILNTVTGECKEHMKRYMNCLKQNNNDNHMCRTESKDYLQCRMDRYTFNQFYTFFSLGENVNSLDLKCNTVIKFF